MQLTKRCAAPWRGLHIDQRGDVKFCCAGQRDTLGNLNQKTLAECIHSEAAQQIRQQIKQGQSPDYCQVCVERERFGGSSERDWHNSVSAEFDLDWAESTDHKPAIIDVRWNTTCNLRCGYCNPQWSSQWAAHLGIKTNTSVRSYAEQVRDYVVKNTTFIKEVAMVGGEPLLLPDNIELLEVVPPSAVITLITNLSVDLESNKVFQRLKNRKRVGWSISFDNIGNRFEFVRHGASWDLLQHNLDVIQNLWRSQQQWGGVHAVHSIYNATRLCEFREYLNSRGLTVVWQTLHTPEFLDPIRLGDRVRAKSIDEINLLLRTVKITDQERQYFQQVKKSYESAQDQNLSMQFQSHLQDKSLAFANFWPELAFLVS